VTSSTDVLETAKLVKQMMKSQFSTIVNAVNALSLFFFWAILFRRRVVTRDTAVECAGRWETVAATIIGRRATSTTLTPVARPVTLSGQRAGGRTQRQIFHRPFHSVAAAAVQPATSLTVCCSWWFQSCYSVTLSVLSSPHLLIANDVWTAQIRQPDTELENLDPCNFVGHRSQADKDTIKL